MENSKEQMIQILKDTEKSVDKLLGAISVEATQEIAKFLLVFSYMLSFSKDGEIRELSDKIAENVVRILLRSGYTPDFLGKIFFEKEVCHD